MAFIFLRRFVWLIGLLVIPVGRLDAQTTSIAGLRTQLAAHPQLDSIRVNHLLKLAGDVRPDDYIEALQLGQEALTLARKLHFPAGEANALFVMGTAYEGRNDYKLALQYLEQAQQRFRQLHNRKGLAGVLGYIGWVNTQQGDYIPALGLGLQSLSLARAQNDSALVPLQMTRLAALYTLLGEYDQALIYYTTALEHYEHGNRDARICQVLNGIGELCRAEGNLPKAIRYYNKAIRLARTLGNSRLEAQAESNLAAAQVQEGEYEQALGTGHRALKVVLAEGKYEVVAWTQNVLARAHLETDRPDSAIYYGQRGWNLSRQIGYKEASRDASQVLALAYARQRNFTQAYEFQQAYMAYNDTLSGRQTQQQLAVLQHEAAQAEQEAAATLRAEEARRQQQWLVSALIGLGLLGVVAVVLWRSNQQQQRTNGQLRRQQAEIQAAQTQLIQREKMASLGELTAGIAHEIQNPLNFVNNFAEVSVELVDELNEEVAAGRTDDMLPLTGDIRQNLTKIHHHGKRADSIVKAMLQHARVSTGERQRIDLNALADEYLRLSYHGMRAKDKEFNAELLTDFDPGLGKVEVIAQDLSRVLLNLFNNAFYAVSERSKQALAASIEYRPQVSIRTRKVGATVEIRVSDNGNGIPEAVLDKIYQPFFTTKPTGEGTGLGLSLSYDIITKGHGGTIEVASEEGLGTTFTIHLPLNNSGLIQSG